MRAGLTRWSAWAAGRSSAADWRRWAAAPEALTESGVPDLPYLPALQRRRFDPLARLMVHVARECAGDEIGTMPTVFASRHGPIDTTGGLLAELAAETPLSPTRFSHSVHNTQHALFSIWAGNRAPSSAVAARDETFVGGFVEALALARRSRAERVLLVVGDIALPPPFQSPGEARHGGYAVAFALAPGQATPGVTLRLAREPGDVAVPAWPPVLEFLRWWLGEQPSLRMGAGGRIWEWTRVDVS